MSFKREGNDMSQLNILKKRRVADLLSNFIPEDEAALMRNGRFTCLMCSYRPVFDTVDMLTVHRKGKRHLEGLQRFYGRKAQLKNEITKRQQEEFVQAEDSRQEPSSSAPLLEQTRRLTHHALLKTVPYNSCHRITSTKGQHNRNPSTKVAQEIACQKKDFLPILSPSSSSSCTSAITESQPLEDTQASQAATVTEKTEPMTAQRRKELEHYLKLKSDGWIRDRGGQWIKDDNVEFDSDEEEPPSLAAPPTDH